jgi:Flp pilus assembly protein TadG
VIRRPTRRRARILERVRGSHAADAGAIAIIVAIMTPVLLGFCALSVDVARWYVEAERVQKAADAAALAGVVYLPQDFPTAKSTAIAVAARNGFAVSSTVDVAVAVGARPSQLQVTVSSTVSNAFATLLGVKTTTISRTAVTDYNGPAPMGSPCNTFGNEPAASAGGALPAGSSLPASAVNPFCTTTPLFWANVEGPATDKIQGDRYSTRTCSSGVDGCTGGKNDEFNPNGYFYIVRVLDPNTQVSVQLYDPAWVYTPGSSTFCDQLPSIKNNSMNQYATTDAQTRYAATNNAFCTGDYNPGGSTPSASNRVDTSFAMRGPADSGNPLDGAPISGCIAQYKGYPTVPTTAELQQYKSNGNSSSGANPSYVPDLAKVFHQWVELCSFTATRAGDYYLQVRTNVALPSGMGSSSLIATGNSAVTSQTGDDTSVTGLGANQFAIRAVAADTSRVSVAGYERMSIDINASNPTTTFNLIRVLPGAAGKYVKFTVFDAADGSSGTIQVQRPTDATGSITSYSTIPGCQGTGVTTGALTGCTVNVSSSTNNGKLQTISVPIPADYSCNYSAAGGCWYRVVVKYSQPTDVTTWNATVEGDPVRIIK